MGYYKSTLYYGPSCFDYSDRSPEAVAERRPRRAPRIATNFDAPTCVVCGAAAPAGYVWTDGICSDCKALASEVAE